MEYEDEPRLVFADLTIEDYCDFYNLEMDSFREDADFYLSYLGEQDIVLELGCGSGRLTRLLADKCAHITGLDNSAEMLSHAQRHRTHQRINYIHGDMVDFHSAVVFDSIIISYNTLNLLPDLHAAKRCLHVCRNLINPEGRLLFQVYHPDKKMMENNDNKLFQFSILKRANGDTVIKETLRSFSPVDNALTLIERYRDRPLFSNKPNRDLQLKSILFTPTLEAWISILQDCGFSPIKSYGTYDCSAFESGRHTTLLMQASPITIPSRGV